MTRSSKRRLSGQAVVALWFVASLGCSHESNNMTCYRNSDCGVGYECNTRTGVCEAAEASCARPSDCALEYNETCAEDGHCVIGSCRLVGCVSGYVCAVGDEGAWACREAADEPSDGGAGGAAGMAEAGAAGMAEAGAAGMAEAGAAGSTSAAGGVT